MSQFINLILFTGFFDLLRLSSVGFPSISGICALLVMLLKVPVFFSCVAKLQERGGDFRLGVPDWNSVQSARQSASRTGYQSRLQACHNHTDARLEHGGRIWRADLGRRSRDFRTWTQRSSPSRSFPFRWRLQAGR